MLKGVPVRSVLSGLAGSPLRDTYQSGGEVPPSVPAPGLDLALILFVILACVRAVDSHVSPGGQCHVPASKLPPGRKELSVPLLTKAGGGEESGEKRKAS